MKRFFLFLFASLLSISMFAENDGATKARAIPYDWNTGIKVDSKAGVGTWYVVGLLNTGDPAGPFLPIGKTADGKTDINVMVVNPLDRDATIDVIAYIGDNETSRHFTLASGGTKSMNFGAGMFVRMGINYVYLYLVMDVDMTPADMDSVQVNVAAVESNSTPFVPVQFNWDNFGDNTEADGNDIAANKETWVKVDWGKYLNENRTFKLIVRNLGSSATTIYGGLAMDCPATNIQEQTKDIAAGGKIEKVIDAAMLDMMQDSLYIRLKADQPLHVTAMQVPPVYPAKPLYMSRPATPIVKGTTYNLTDSIVYRVDSATLAAPQYYVTKIELKNNGTEDVVLKGKASKTRYYKAVPEEGKINYGVYSAVSRDVTIGAGKTISKEIDKTMLSNLGKNDSVYALVLNGNSNISFKLYNECTEKDPCDPDHVTALTVPATGSVEQLQAANSTVWYKVNIANAKSAHADIRMTMTASETVNLTVDIAADCALGEPTQSYTGSSATTVKTLSYSLIKDAGDVIYVRVNTNKAITVQAEILNAIVYNMDQYASTNGWSNGDGPTINDAARIETDMTIASDKTVKALGLTLAGGNIIIKNGGKLIVGAEGIKGSATVDQITIEEDGILLIDPACSTNNKPFVTAQKKIKLGIQSEWNDGAGPATLPELHDFIALPIDNREAAVGQQMRYVHWDRMAGWIANDGFRQSFVGYNVFAKAGDGAYADPAALKPVEFKGQLAANKDITLNMPAKGWYAFGNSWTAPIALSGIYSQLSGSNDEAAVHFYVATPTDLGAGIGTILDNYYIPATAEIASNLGITEIKPMQGFFLYTEGGNSVTLDYHALYASKAAAPKRVVADNRNMVAAVLSNANGSDFVYMIEGEASNAHKMINDKLAIYAEDGLAQVANTNLIGTILTIQTTKATEYTLSFAWLKGETLYLKDLENGNIIAMTADSRYTFSAEPNTLSERFQVVGRQEVPTNIENGLFLEGANKRIENGKIVIIKNGVKYDVLGAQL